MIMNTGKDLFQKTKQLLIALILLNAAACASGQSGNKAVNGSRPIFKDNSSKAVVKNNDSKNYNDLLVDVNSYSTNGRYYQDKYHKQLISIAGEIVEGQDLDVTKQSIGFYYDKKSKRTDRLFLGVDINTKRESGLDYGRFSVKLIKENVSGIVDLMYRYKAILEENEIVGIVIGFKWAENNSVQQVNIWIKKDDLHLFYEGKITLNEMYQRSTVTNTAGKIILLPI